MPTRRLTTLQRHIHHNANKRAIIPRTLYYHNMIVIHDRKGLCTLLTLDIDSLQNADLRDANLENANLVQYDLQGADLRGANLTGADLRLANLSGADLRGADLSAADFVGANLEGALTDNPLLLISQ